MRRFLFLALFLLSFSATAIPIFHGIVFFVDDVDLPDPEPCTTRPSCHVFSPDINVGDTYFGRFSVDDSLLAVDGDDVVLPVQNVLIRIDSLIWNQNDPASIFEGATPTPGGPVFPPALGFDVHGGRIIDVFGGVFGLSDTSAVDFGTPSGGGPNRFLAVDGTNNAVSGTFALLVSISEPSTLAITGTGLLVGLVRLRRRRRLIFT